ncbi:hypothetical protein [Kaistella sp.]|uniref:hypothetical protein n=1 Tax=Kaistella sp. TaxID=2782235 RepID=UPI003C657334
MDKKRILIVTSGFYPEQSPRAFRATELAKEFCRQGHEVVVMAPHKENVQPLLEEFPIQFVDLGQLMWHIPNVKGCGKLGAFCNKAINRLLPLLFAFPQMEIFFMVKRKLKSEPKNYDLLISIAVPHPIHWGIASVWSKKKEENIAPLWISDCGDPYYIQENDTFRPPFYFKWVEEWFMRKTDFITVPTETSYRGYLSEFHPKLKVIPQGFRFEDIDKKAVLNDGIVRLGYGGGFTLGRRDPRELLDFLTNLDQSVRFEFHLFTAQSQFIEPYIKDSRIKLHPPIPRTELLEILSTFNFVVNIANIGLAQTPSKLIDYAIIEKPILQIISGNLDREVVLQFMNGNYEKQFITMNPERYRIEEVVKQFLNLSISGKDQQ